jgi:hypothetical protein
MYTHREVMKLWPTRAALARELGISDKLVYAWYRRDSIPPRHWHYLAQVARKRGLSDVTADLLAAIKARDLTRVSLDQDEYDMA